MCRVVPKCYRQGFQRGVDDGFFSNFPLAYLCAHARREFLCKRHFAEVMQLQWRGAAREFLQTFSNLNARELEEVLGACRQHMDVEERVL